MYISLSPRKRDNRFDSDRMLARKSKADPSFLSFSPLFLIISCSTIISRASKPTCLWLSFNMLSILQKTADMDSYKNSCWL